MLYCRIRNHFLNQQGGRRTSISTVAALHHHTIIFILVLLSLGNRGYVRRLWFLRQPIHSSGQIFRYVRPSKAEGPLAYIMQTHYSVDGFVAF